MANTIALKRRIGSIKNTRQITKAMELVSASKMRSAQEYAKQSREYREIAYDLMAKLGQMNEVKTNQMFKSRKVKAKLHILITSNLTLAGAYNYNAIKQVTNSITEDRKSNIKSSVIAIGKQGAQHIRRLEGVDLLAVYTDFSDHPTENDIKPILNTVIELYQTEKVDAVSIVYTNFVSNLVQQIQETDLLPAKATEQVAKSNVYISNFEPSVDVVLDSIVTRLIEVQIWQALLESLASEHSMRMLAMKNATDNANDLIDDYTLQYNTARQANITQELAEIIGGAEALKE
jgi:F-type H+-transporting ATPase subunit gamma